MKYSKKVYLPILALLLCCLYNGSSKAQTAGPTAPEYSSFEPVDVTDMVNLASGDFTYTIPLIEVPGPEGGYPLALSYHAGIKPEQEASWVGLGWTLNAGAINRIVNNFPDDQIATNGVQDFQEGGASYGGTVGISLGPPLGPNIGTSPMIQGGGS